MKTFCILFIFWANTNALYPPADYDSIVTSSIDIRHGEKIENRDDCVTEKSQVIGRPAIEHFIAKLKSDYREEKPKKPALLIRRPVLITSLSGKPAEIIEIENNEKVNENSKDAFDKSLDEKSISEGPIKIPITIENPAPVAPVAPLYNYGQLYPLQDCEYPNLYANLFPSYFGYGYPIYPPAFQIPALTYGPPNVVSAQKFDEEKDQEAVKPVPYSPLYSGYQIPSEYGLPDVTIAQKFNNEKESEIIQPLYTNPIPYPEQFGYNFQIYSPTYQVPIVPSGLPQLPPVPALEYGPPKESENEQLSFDEKTDDNDTPVIPATEYGPPKITNPIFSPSAAEKPEYSSLFSHSQQLPLDEKLKSYTVNQYRFKKDKKSTTD